MMDVQNVAVTVDKNGKEETKTSAIVHRMLLDSESHDLLIDVVQRMAEEGAAAVEQPTEPAAVNEESA